MHIQLALVCDDARMRPDGKMDVEGVFNDLAAPGFPAKQERMVLVTTIEWDRGEEGRNKFRVDLMGPEGRPSLTVDGETEVDRRPPDRPPPRTRLIMPLEDVIFPRPGKYTFEVRVKGKRLRGPSIFVMEVESRDGGTSGNGGAALEGGSEADVPGGSEQERGEPGPGG
jgi:hypothetical protein